MGTSMKPLLLLSLLLTLAGCGGGNSTKLEVSKAFAMANGYYAGGLIVFGENTNGNKFSVALDANLETTLTLANGSWTFYAIGWDGGVNNYKFEGIQHCGATTQEISASSTVNITVNAAGCSEAAFVNAIKPTNITPTSCGTFYTYLNTFDEYYGVVAATPSNYCSSLPTQFHSPYNYYRVAANEKINGSITTKYLSECKLINADALNLPTGKIPLTIQKFKAEADCISGVANNFPFPEGIEIGNDQNFEHQLIAGKLLLPSSKTRRGTSPFINMLPRILCGAAGSYNDCFADIDTLSTQVVVPWSGESGGEQLLFKQTSAATCPVALLDNAKYFNATDCQVKDKNIYAKVSRNALTCQPATSQFTGVLDIYSANGKIYLLRDGAPDYVEVYNFKGQRQADISLAGISDAEQIAVSINAVFILTPGAIKKYDLMGGPQWTTTIVADDIDVSPDGTEVAVALPFVGNLTVKTYDSSNGVLIDSLAGGSGTGPFKIAYDQVNIYVLYPATGNVTKFPVDPAGSLSPSSIILNYASAINIIRSDIANEFFVLGSDATVKRYTAGGSVLPPSLTGAVGQQFALTDTTSFKFFFSDSNYLKMYQVDALTLVPYSTHADECTDSHAITSGGSTQTLTYKTRFNTAYHSYAEALKFVGRRTIAQIENATYIFPDLSHDDDEIEAGGMLDLVQSDLSSTGIAGLLGKDYPTCDLLKARVADGSTVTASRNIYLPHRMENVQVSASVTKSSTALPPYVCVGNDPSGSACPGGSVYDLDFSFTVTHALSTEKGRAKLVCNRKLGSFETLDQDENFELRRELFVWNTEDDTKARFERYEYQDEGANDYRASIAKLQKSTAQNFLAREVRVESRSTSADFNGSETELQRFISSPDKLLTKRTDFSESDLTTFFSLHAGSTSNLGFNSQTAPSCGNAASSIFSPHLAGCTFTGTIPTSSKGLNLNLNSFNYSDQSAIKGVFGITP